jgi:hypothetical protein
MRVERLAKEAPHRSSFRVVIEGRPTLGVFSESIRFITTSQKQEVVIVPVHGEMVACQQVTPTCLLLKTTPAGSKVEAKFAITAQADAGSGITSVESKAADWQVVSWHVGRVSETRAFLQVELRVPSAAGYKRTFLVLRGEEGTLPQEVLLTCLVSEKESN